MITIESLTAERDEARQMISALTAERNAALQAKAEAITARKQAEAKAMKAQEDLKTAYDRAEQSLREIAARNGQPLPPKVTGRGDFTGTANSTEGLTGIAKATAYLEQHQPTECPLPL